jgi:REP element-mobilizing transposase RayT
MANRPPRLDRLFEEYSFPLCYITFNTKGRGTILAEARVQERFEEFGARARSREIYLGRYVLMPDHVHLFVAGPRDFDLAAWVRMLKLCLSTALHAPRPHWQEGAFDHLIRSSESYGEKWEYVRLNPVNAGLVAHAEDWPFQGEMNMLPFD